MAKITRKEFLKLTGQFFTVIGLGAVTGPIISYFYPSELEEMPTEPLPVGPVEELPIGKSKTIKFGRYPALVINTDEGLKDSGKSFVPAMKGISILWMDR